jgi:hypothetical protein
MSTPPLSKELAQEAIAAFYANGQNKAAAARSLNDMNVSTYKDRLNVALGMAARGEFGTDPVIPGFAIAKVSTEADENGSIVRRFIQQKPEVGGAFNVPEGHSVKGVSALLDAQGNVIQQWMKTKEDGTDPIRDAERIVAIFNEMTFAVPEVPSPTACDAECLSQFNIPDIHMGLYVYGEEASENWNLKKADRVYRQAFADLMAMTPRTGEAVILAGGDQMHADNSRNRTEQSGNHLDVDGRYDLVLQTTCELFLHFILTALQTHARVQVRILKGNHDPHSTAALAYFLLASFRNEPRVTVDVSPSLFWVYQFGNVMLAATHGHEAKPQRMPGIMAARWPRIWGDTQFRYAHTFHVHHRSKYLDEDGGVIVETHQSPAPADSWHFGQGFLSGRSLRSIVYHRKYGEFGGSVRPILPE